MSDMNRKKVLIIHGLELANLIGSVFLLDQKIEKDEVIFRLKELIGVLRRFPPEEFNLFRMWLSSIATIGLSEKSKESVIKILEESNPEEVEKMVYNLAETLKKMEEDVMLAREEGIEKGFEKGKIQVAKNMLAKNITPDLTAEVTGLSMEEIKTL
jgi:predicted transposase/invertase (TIGR01784 family)